MLVRSLEFGTKIPAVRLNPLANIYQYRAGRIARLVTTDEKKSI